MYAFIQTNDSASKPTDNNKNNNNNNKKKKELFRQFIFTFFFLWLHGSSSYYVKYIQFLFLFPFCAHS